jgi:hypothetical protein
MNSTAEQVARKTCAELYDPDRVRVRVRTSWQYGFCLPDPKGASEETAVFATMTFGDNYAIEQATTYDLAIGEKISGGVVTIQVTDLNEYKRLMIKRCLLSWSLDVPIERDEAGWMTPESYARVSSVPAPLLSAFLSGFEDSIQITEEEEQKISRQCAVLFSKTGHGVSDACEAVSKFCTLGNFSEKFGINREMLPRIPYREFLLLRIMIGKETDAMKVSQPKGGSTTQIVGAGGRVRPSKGVKIPLP